MNEQLCPVAQGCGGCQLLDMPYSKQLEFKQSRVEKLLSSFCPVEQITGMEDPFHYRNKVHAVFAEDERGRVYSGVYAMGTHRVVPVENCLIEDARADEIIAVLRRLIKKFRLRAFDEDSGNGFFRHALVRVGKRSGQILVVLVIGKPVFPVQGAFVQELVKACPDITSVVVNLNGQKTSMVLGPRSRTVFGRGFIEDTLCGKRFAISPQSFYQVNSVQTEKLYRKAVDCAALTGSERVLDAYCGIGTIGIVASDFAREVIGVELNPAAVRDAVANARRNGAENARFFQNDAGAFMRGMAARKEKLDAVFLDPPRAGSDEKFLSALCALAPARAVYISCMPETLTRDLKYLTAHGYRAVSAAPFDMFPFTNHVETVVSLAHKKH